MSRPPFPEPPEGRLAVPPPPRPPKSRPTESYRLDPRGYRPVSPPPPDSKPPRTFSLFAYQRGDSQGETDQRRYGVPEWKLEQAVRWALADGRDTVLVEVSDREPTSTPGVTHHMCSDSRCPGGCD